MEIVEAKPVICFMAISVLLQANSAIYFDKNDNDHAEFEMGTHVSCLTDVSSCEHVSLAFWVKITEPCVHNGGIIGAKAKRGGTFTEGFQVYCSGSADIL